MKTYEEMAQQVCDLSNSLFSLSKELEGHYKKNMKPGERPMHICYIAQETLKNMSFTLETLGDTMLGN